MTDREFGVVIGDDGQCNCCKEALARMPLEWWPGPEGVRRLTSLVDQLKISGRGKPYDALVGLSGGVDSAYLAYRMSGLGLRLLAVHVDAGWNSEPAVHNIEKLVRGLDLDLYTHVVEWSEMRDVQLAFLKAGVLNQDFPQDHAFFATLNKVARQFKIKNFLTGVNFASENLQVPHGAPSSTDGTHLRAIHSAFGDRPLRSFPVMTMTEYLWSTKIRGWPHRHRPLDFLPYDKEAARRELEGTFGWRDYGPKHSESRFTKFYQEIYLPRKFGVDKRRLHLSSLIVSGQLTREAALRELACPIAQADDARRDLRFVAKKMGIGERTLEGFIDASPRPHAQFASAAAMTSHLLAARNLMRSLVNNTSHRLNPKP